MKTFVQLAAMGVAGYLGFKLVSALLLPLLGLAAGLLGLAIKVALVMVVGWVVLRLLRGGARKERTAV